jgi:hypothetical protein
MSLLVQGKKVPTRFRCWIRTTGQNQVVTAATTSYGLRLGGSWTSQKAYKVYFHMDPDPCHIFSEKAAIIDLLQRPFLSTVLHHLILARWCVYQVGPHRSAS